MTTRPRLKVVFVAGPGRSGSTLLDNILGQIDGVFSSGELMYAWDRGVLGNALCGCGSPFQECEVWGPLHDELPALAVGAARESAAIRERLTPRRALSWAHGLGDGSSVGLDRYCRRLGEIYSAIAERTEASIIVDSSKIPGHGYAISRLANVDLRVVHLVRDARAVAHAWQKVKIYDPTGDEPTYMSTLSPLACSRQWMLWNLVTELIWQDDPVYQRLRYDDLVLRPRATLSALATGLDLEPASLPLVAEGRVRLGPTHALAGNPSRFATGPVQLRLDDAWQRQQPAAQRRLVTALTWPLLGRYGFFA